MAIRDLDSLRSHLQWAIELEHATIPPYLYALYTIKEGTNREAANVLLSVVIEEMLHMTLAANVLNAIGGTPRLDHPAFMPTYPAYLPHSNRAFLVPLAKFSKETLATFLQIEKPEAHHSQPEDENYETIGQFYEALEAGLVRLCGEQGEASIFTGDPNRQLGSEAFHYDGSGAVRKVTDLASARKALEEIVDQGEGQNHKAIWDGDRNMFHPEREEISHYFRLNEIYIGRSYQRGDTPHTGPTGEPFPVDWNGVYDVRSNPRSADFPPGSPIRVKLDAFNQTYFAMLRLLHRSFNGEPACMSAAIGAMYEIKVRAGELMRMPSGDGETNVGLSFEYVPQQAAPAASSRKITVRANGPYIVEGDIPLRRKSRVMSEQNEALTWKKEAVIEAESPCALCRCGLSDAKPFCDGSHVRGQFDGTEVADSGLRANRTEAYPGPAVSVKHDRTICAFATFCENKITDVWAMAAQTNDIAIRSQVVAMIERCPSGALTYELMPQAETNEPDYPEEIAVITDGPLWVTGGLTIERADGQPVEVRNRVTLCRCGQSHNKPFCDGTHIDVKFRG